MSTVRVLTQFAFRGASCSRVLPRYSLAKLADRMFWKRLILLDSHVAVWVAWQVSVRFLPKYTTVYE